MGKETACCTLCGLRQACPAIGIFIGIENSAVYMMGILVNSRARLRNSPPPSTRSRAGMRGGLQTPVRYSINIKVMAFRRSL